MNFNIKRKINNGVFSINISFESFGSDKYTEEEEKLMMQKYGYPVINVGGKPFTRNLQYNEGNKLIELATESESGEEVVLVRNSANATINENFNVNYVIDPATVKDDELTTLFTTPLAIAEAKCVLFEEGIKKRISDALLEVRDKETDFEKDYPSTMTI